MPNLTSRIAGLSEEKRQLLERLLKAQQVQVEEALILPRRRDATTSSAAKSSASDEARCSFGQERLWFLDRLEPGSSVYNMPNALRLKGEFEVAVLGRTLGEIVQRHEVLRTTFREVDGEPRQVIAAERRQALPLVDLSGLGEELQEAELIRLAADDARRPFDLERGPLLRTAVVRLAGRDHAVLLNLHHAITDGVSMGIFVREVMSIYGALIDGRPHSLPELPVQYGDYAEWQRKTLGGDSLEAEVAWWREHLAGAVADLGLPTDRPRAAALGSVGTTLSRQLPQRLCRGLERLGRRGGATLFMVLAAVLQILLGRFSGQRDLNLGIPIAGRSRAETEGLIGLFVNTLVLRGEVVSQRPFRAHLEQVRRDLLATYEHQELPFEKLVEELAPERDLSRTPLFQAMVALESATAEEGELSGLTLKAVETVGETAKFDLNLSFVGDGEGLQAFVEYRTELFGQTTVLRLWRCFEVLLAEVVADPGRPLGAYGLLGPAERAQVMVQWSSGPAPPKARAMTFPQVFSKVVRRRPEVTALVQEAESLSYGHLDLASNRLARRLMALGVGPESRVGLCMERSPGMVVAMLGVLKAGAAYVPLDPNYPADRLRHMASAAQLHALVSTSLLLPDVAVPARLDLDHAEDLAVLHGESPAPPAARVLPEGLAYIIFTSGSTGVPKGVALSHHNLAWYAQEVSDFYRIEPEDRVLQFASISFDISVEEIFASLSSAATLVLATEPMTTVEGFLARAACLRTTLWSPPTAWWHELSRGMIEAGQGWPASLRQVIFGGERVLAERVRAWQRHTAGRTPLINTYGPTETTVVALAYRVADAVQDVSAVSPGMPEVPIGRPLAGVRVAVVDRRGESVPVGVGGELAVAGLGVGRGYLQRPAETAARFVPDPADVERGGRRYLTGDRVRFLADGRVDFLGRLDQQLKVRGFRVEPGEIESVLESHPAVQGVAVGARPVGSGDLALVAWVVAAQGDLEAEDLRQHLSGLLPQYLVPSAFVLLEALPLTPSGKVDRRALPEPEELVVAAEGMAPRTPVEELVASVWAEVLGLETVGVEQDFFSLGGHSLLATRVMSRLRGIFHVEIPLRALFEGPTVAALAQVVELARLGEARSLPPLQARQGDEEELPLSFGQERLWFLDRLEPDNPAYNMPLPLRLRGPLELAFLEAALVQVVRRHEVLRTRFVDLAGRPVQVIDPPPQRWPIALVDLQGLAEEPREQLVLDLVQGDAGRTFDLARGPLLRVFLVRLSAADHVAVVNLQHIVTDGWSLSVLVREIGALYDAAHGGRPSPLTPLRVQYADFALWQRAWLVDEELERQLDFWRQSLAGVPARLELTTDRPRPVVQATAGGAVGVAFAADVSTDLKAFSRSRGATPFMTLMAAFQILLMRWSGQSRVAVGTPIAGRRHLETEDLIGFFVNTLVLVGDGSDNPAFGLAVDRVRDSALAAFEHQDLPFEKLVSELSPERSLSHSPVFQVMLSLQNAPEEGLRLAELSLEALAADSGVTKYELNLSLATAGESIVGGLTWATALFDTTTVERLLNHLQVVLAAGLADPTLALAELPLMTAVERAQLVLEWNDTERPAVSSTEVHGLFQVQAEQQPDAAALVFEDQQWSYGGLLAQAHRLAHRLQRAGVGPEVPVAILMERSGDVVVAQLAAFQAGGAWLVLDPQLPWARLAQMLEASGAAVLLAPHFLWQAWPEPKPEILWLDPEDPTLSSEPTSLPEVRTHPSNLAYIQFTSGSTGLPKGVCVGHSHLASYVRGVLGALAAQGLPGAADFALVSTFATDLGQTAVWPALCGGGRLHIIASSRVADAQGMAEYFDRHPVDCVKIVPSHLQALLEGGDARVLPRRLVVSGGEALPVALVRKIRSLGCDVLNHYGPTETTVGVTTQSIPRALPEAGWIPVGRPLGNVRLFVVDRTLRLVPVGVAGELVVGGASVSRGYLAARRTAEVFVPDPFAGSGERLYRTGDLMRRLADGAVEFLGRTDDQVKIRGFRVEPKEIESVLRRHPAVTAAVVGAVADVQESPGDSPLGGGQVLVAWVVGAEGRPEIDSLREDLGDLLPHYMVPSAFVTLEEIPLTAAGKVDRRALPPPTEVLAPTTTGVAPRTPIEELVASVWAEVLGRDVVWVDEDFFSLGGHSLLATRVMSRLRGLFEVEIPLRALFEGPTVEQLAREVEAARGQGERTLPPLVPRQRGADDDLPLSFAQERLWFLDRLEPGSAAYNIPMPLRLVGTLHVPLLEATLAEMVRRHESLRTRFVEVEGEPVQRIDPPPDHWPLAVVDLSGLMEERRGTVASRLLAADATRPFDLMRGPVLRAFLTRLGPAEHLAMVNVHHIVSDGWSLGVLVREVGALYDAYQRGAASPLEAPAAQYADYALWQRGWLVGDELARQVEFWQKRLAEVPVLLELPTDQPRPAVQSTAGASQRVRLPTELGERLVAWSREHGATPFMSLLAAFQMVLTRWSGQSLVAVGTPIAGRRHLETEGMIGFFVNTLVLVGDGGGNPTFGEYVEQVREMALQAYEHQDLPFEKLVEELSPERSLSHSPLFQVMFALQNVPQEELVLGDLRLEAVAEEAALPEKFDISLALAEEQGRIGGVFNWSRALFDPSTVERMVIHFERLLASGLDAPTRGFLELPLLSAVEREQVAEWSGARLPAPPSAPTFAEAFAEVVQRQPHVTAVVQEAESISYGQLDAASNRLARRLIALGVGPESRVGLCLERNPGMVVALLGILKTGAAYIPLDPQYPVERLRHMASVARLHVLVTTSRLMAELELPRRLDLDRPEVQADLHGESPAPLVSRALPAALAYVIFTSGSTGLPKGVSLSHRNLVSYAATASAFYGLGPEDRVLQFASISFDISVKEIFPALGKGATLVLVTEAMADVEVFLERSACLRTTLWCPPTAWWHEVSRALSEEGRAWPSSLRQVVAGGERMLAERVRAWQQTTGGISLINSYGPTETTVSSLGYVIEGTTSWGAGEVPIGKPLQGVRVAVVDRRGSPVPVGVGGELALSGLGVGRGYLERPAETAMRFIPDPESSAAGGRRYLTGDRVRFLADGSLDFLGRLDQQLKIRGFRIEPGEIESVLEGHPAVQGAVVGAHEITSGDHVLVAWVVAAEEDLESESLRQYLSTAMPHYLVPSAFVLLDTLPLTPAGKVDRRSLPAPTEMLAPLAGQAPQTLMEDLVAEVWAEVLGLETVGVDQDFFSLGGHSLLATRVMSRLRRLFSVEIPLRALFEGPTVRDLVQVVEKARLGEERSLPALVARQAAGAEGLPLSFAQERLWFLDRLEPGSTAYNIPLPLRLTGSLDIPVLSATLSEVERRHESLRTRFVEVAGEPVQRVDPWRRRGLPVVDLGGLEKPVREALAAELVAQDVARPFDLGRGPLLRVFLVRLAAKEHLAVVNQHHIISDGWSLGVLVREVGELYDAFLRGLPVPLPPLPVQYADYALWQRSWLAGKELDRQVRYWRQRLEGVPALLELPTDRPRPAIQQLGSASRDVVLSQDLGEELLAWSRQHGATPFMTLLAAFQILLMRWSGQPLVAVGTPIAGRRHSDTEGLIGFFVNTLVLVGDGGGNPTFSDFVARARESALVAYEHQDLPFEKLVEELSPERSLSHSPIFQVMFALQNIPRQELNLAQLQLQAVDSGPAPEKFDLSLALMEGNGRFGGSLGWSDALFDNTTVGRLVECLELILVTGLGAPELDIAELPMLSPAQRAQVSWEWNDTAVTLPAAASLSGLFEAQVEQFPAAPALRYGVEELSYRELNVRSNRLARYLRRQGVGEEARVGVLLERSAEMIVAFLAILKAGGVYLPLDLEYPASRLGFMVEDSMAVLVLTRDAVRSLLPEVAAPVVSLEEVTAAIDSEAEENLGLDHGGDHLAYVIYTSGSTGRPKGVAATHRSVLRVVWETNYIDLGSGTRVGQGSNASFDAATFEIWGALLHGGCLVGVSRDVLLSPADFASEIAAMGIEVLFLTTAVFNQLATAGEGTLAGLRHVLFGGEAADPGMVARALAESGVGRLANIYGPTECTTFSSFHEVRSIAPSATAVPIGLPITNTTLHLLDAHLRRVPLGASGELCIGGPGLARGYLNRPALTAEYFIPNAEDGEPGARLYRTGDRVRQIASGPVEYQGRFDHQVKLRGFRIELGEIESRLAAHPGLDHAVVLLRQDGALRARLVAYLVVKEGRDPDAVSTADLRQWVGAVLPEYMVPARYVFLEAFPLNANGKVDRARLPSPGTESEEVASVAVPRSPEEELLAAIFAEVLGLENVGVDQNFFELGGHSLLATQVISRVRDAFEVDLPLRQLFEGPTVIELAKAVGELRRGEGRALPPLLPRGEETAELPLSFAQERLWFLDQLEPGTAAYNIPLPLHLEGPLVVPVLAATLAEVVRRHESLRTRFVAARGGPVQVIDRPPTAWAVPVVDLEGIEKSVRQRLTRKLLIEDARRPFDLARGALLRTFLLRWNASEHFAVVNQHHIVSDGWSLGVLMREVGTIYEAFHRGEPPLLPELPVQYGDYALWVRSWLRGEELERQMEFWRQQLAGVPSLLELPTDRPRPAVQRTVGTRRAVRFPEALSSTVLSWSREHGSTPFMTLLTAFQMVLARWSSQTLVAVGTPVAGRRHLETEGLIGFFVNTLVLRGDYREDPPFGVAVGRVRETALSAFEHQDLPFEKLVMELSPERALSHSPLFQVMFALQNMPEEKLQLEGLRLTSVASDAGMEKFDLSLMLAEQGALIEGSLSWSQALFDPSTMDRLFGHLERLLAGGLTCPERRFSELDLLSPGERSQVLVQWNDTALVLPTTTLHGLFEVQVQRNPDAEALVCGAERLTYGELEEQANQVAHRLRALGVGPEVVVGVCVDRRPRLVAALLGVLKAGGAYLPLDPSYPAARLSFMLEDAGAAVLIVGGEGGEVRGMVEAVLDLDAEASALAAGPATRPASRSLPGCLAYVIYTSGSTGLPKGVALAHRGGLALVEWARRNLSADDLSGLLASTSISFDLSVFELFVPLALGGRVVLVENALSLISGAVEAEVRVLNTVPSVLTEVLASGSLPREVETVILAGEALAEPLVEALYAEGTVRRVINLYGPSEETTYSTGCLVPSGLGRAPDIGFALPGTRAYVVDGGLSPVGLGIVGELVLGGAGVARGYLGRPGLSAERFVPDSLSAVAGERLYRTGDRVRRLAGGALEFLGRFDHQVKLRGFRIELGELEARLSGHAEVRQAVVVLRTEGVTPRLVGYVTCVEAEPAVEDLRQWLAAAVPEYMIPSLFVFLEEFPRTDSGKVDRRSLPALADVSSELSSLQARTPLEELLAAIFVEVLGLETVGVDQGFFALGGHSLLATQVISRIRDAFGVDLPLRVLFEGSTVMKLARAVEELRRGEGRPLPPILPRGEEAGDLPLSFAQERLWFLNRLDPEATTYNMPMPLRLVGDLRLDLLQATLGEMVRRHESLRTRFVEVLGQAVQRIDPPPLGPHEAWPLPLIDLSGLSEERRGALASRLVAADAARPFDLARGPLLRAFLLRLEPAEHVVMVNQHHIVSDGWSLGILVREVTTLYDALHRGAPLPLPPLAVQYADYALWQRSWLVGDELARQVEFWRQRLAEVPAVLELPMDRPRPSVQSTVGARRGVSLPPELGERVVAWSRERSATPFMTLLAAFQMVLTRWSGQPLVAVGTPIAGRRHLETEGMIGFFVNTLVLVGDGRGQPTFGEYVERVREGALSAYEHQDLPFEKLVEELSPERSLSHSPLFQVMFALQNVPEEELVLGDLRLETVMGASSGSEKFDLSLMLSEEGGRIGGSLSWSLALFDESTMERLAGHLELLLAAGLETPSRGFLELPLLSAAEREQVAVEWSGLQLPLPRFAPTFLETFAGVVRRCPDVTAVVQEAESTSYGALDEASNRLARRLMALGVGVESRVGFCLSRSTEMVVTILGILKAGAAYVPLDPKYPADRLRRMASVAGLDVLVTRFPLLPEFEISQRLDLGRSADLATIGGESPAPLSPRALPEALAYVIFTSGSTGLPKGVSLSHHNLAWYAAVSTEFYGMKPSDRVLQFASISFDISVKEIFFTLGLGATLVLATEPMADVGVFLERTACLRTTLWFLPTAWWHEVSRGMIEGGGPRPTSLRQVACGGERILAERVAAWQQHASEMQLINSYGPTETTVAALEYRVRGTASWSTGEVPIGRPFAGVRIGVVDRRGEPVPVGVGGELVVGGLGVGRGYLGQPAETALRFVPEAEHGEPGARRYLTGDRVRFLADGRVDFLGRLDQQVKVRGFRIEPGEIESALESHPAVAGVVVGVREITPGDNTLVAWVVASHDALEIEDLRQHLGTLLPHYMVPSAFVPLDALPLTPAGKVDRRALPAPSEVLASSSGLAPRTPIEELVASVWSEVLGLEVVWVDQDFFRLGGHSLLATRVMSRLRGLFDVEIPLRALFEEPTVAALARAVEAARGEGGRALPPLTARQRETDDALPLSFAQERLWFLSRLDPEAAAYNMPMPLRLVGDLHLALLEATLAEMVRRHESLRTRFVEVLGQAVQRIDPPPPSWPLPLVDLSGLSEERRGALASRLVAADAARPFDLARGPLLRAFLLRLGPAEHVVMVNQHHIVSDGWSLGILVREVTTLYDALHRGAPSPLPPLAVQYADYALWQRSWLVGDELARQVEFWQQRLADVPAVLELPTDRPRPSVQSTVGARCRLDFPPELGDRVVAWSREHGATPFMTLLAAFQMVLTRWSGQALVAVGTPIAGRRHLETEGMIGFFVNTLVLVGDGRGQPTFGEYVERVREGALSAYEHQDLPFEKLVEELSPERSLSHSPVFQVMFALQNVPEEELVLGDLRLESVAGASSGSENFDLSLVLTEQGGRIGGGLSWSRALFDESTMARLAGHFQLLLSAGLKRPSRGFAALPLLSAAEHQQVAVEWSSAQRSPEPFASTFPQAFAEVVRRCPDTMAVVQEAESTSYGALNGASNRLARRLVALGIGPESRVGLCLERSTQMVVAMLGILKAGAAYVPLDSKYPADRLRHMASAAQLDALVSVSRLLPDLAVSARLDLDREKDQGDLHGENSAGLARRALPEALAYVIFTSGSTGLPKGVALSHRNLAWYTRMSRDLYGIEPQDRVLQFASISFDISVEEIFTTLGSAATLVLATESMMDVGVFLERSSCLRTTLWSPPTAWWHELSQGMMGAGGGWPTCLRQVIIGGERVLAERVRTWQRHTAGQVPLINSYGPTETTVSAVAYRIAGEVSWGAGEVPIGHPLEGVRVAVIDRRGEPVPVGVGGELAVGGLGVGRGYLNQPAETAARFVPEPFPGGRGERRYLTGDRVRYLADGRLDFLGRLDQQVKVRGFRVEPGEIESVLESHPAVQGAAVGAREMGSGDLALVAWVVGEEDLEIEGLRQHLSAVLPHYMVPSAFVVLDQLPLTPVGKVDRRALLASEVHRAGGEDTASPRDEIEHGLQEIWHELLGFRARITDSFFDFGGNSLLAVRLVAQIERRFQQRLPVWRIFEAMTIERQALLLRQQPGAPATGRPAVIELQPKGEGSPLFLFHALSGEVFGYKDLVRNMGTTRPCYGVQTPDLWAEEGEAPESLEAMAAVYVDALQEVGGGQPYLLAGWSMAGSVAYEVARQLMARGERVAMVAMLDTSPPLTADKVAEVDQVDLLQVLAEEYLHVSLSDGFTQLSHQAQVDLVLVKAVEQGVLPPGVNAHRIEDFLRNMQFFHSYVPGPYPGRVYLLRAAESRIPAEYETWGELVAGGCEILPVPGDHDNIVEEPYVQELAATIKKCIQSALEEDT